MAARWAMGTKVQRLNPVSGAYDDIIGLGDITGPSESVDMLDVTSHSSPNESEEKIPTVHRHGTISAPMRFDPSNAVHIALLSDKQSKRLGTYKLIMTDTGAAELSFTAYVTELSYSFPVAGALTQNFQLTLTGALTLTP